MQRVPKFFLFSLVIVVLFGCSSQKRLARKVKKEKYDKALALANKNIQRYEKKSDLRSLEKILPYYMSIGEIQRNAGNYKAAERTYLHARELSKKRLARTGGSAIGLDFEIVDDLAEVLMESGNYNGAGEILRESIEARQKKYGKKNVKRYRSNLYYGQYLMTQGRYEEAYTFLKDNALFIHNKVYNTFELHDFDKLAEAYEWLTKLELILGNVNEATRLAYKNLKYQDHRWAHRLAGKNNLNRIESYNLVAICELQQGDLETAFNYSDKALKTYDDVLNEPTIHKITTLKIRAQLYWKANRYDDVFKAFREINEIQLKFVKDNLARLTEYEQANFVREAEENAGMFYNFAKEVLEKKSPLATDVLKEVFNLQINTKAKLLDESSKRIATLAESEDPGVREKFETWRNLRNEYARLITTSSGGNAREKINSINREISDVEKALSLEIAGFGESAPLVTWKEIASRLNDDEVAIETIRLGNGMSCSYLFLGITKDSESPKFEIIQNGDTIENRLFKYYLNANKTRTTDTISYRTYFAPIRKLVGDKTVIHFSADGIYNFINLAILSNGTNYLLDNYTVINHTNTKNIRASTVHRVEYKTATLFGRPQYGDDPLPEIEQYMPASDTLSRAILSLDAEIPDLPGTEREIKAIQKLLEEKLDVKVNLHTRASEEQVKQIRSTDILHIATHGFFIGDAFSDPMLNSGLLFSGVNSRSEERREDGLFTAYEATSLDLSETELVVLSACETGLGEIRNGEGVYGLQRAFEIAGANNILMSLWRIDDSATAELMESFYEELIANGNPTLALKNAQERMRRKPELAHPYYWGAFKLVGE